MDSSDCFLLQTDLDIVELWCNSNGLELNINKCKLLRFSRSGTISGRKLENVSDFCDLGGHS